MNDDDIQDIPMIYGQLISKSEEIGCSMPSDLLIGPLLKTLLSSKPKSNILELGTGIGLSLSWMIDGMDDISRITTVDNDPNFSEIARSYFGSNDRVEIVCADGSEWLRNYVGDKFDLIFADAWPGKYSDTDEVLDLLKVGGIYIIDDMSEQDNWPEGHERKVVELISYLEKRQDFNLTKISWSSGIIIASKLL